MGPDGLLIELASLATVHAAYEELREARLPGVADLVPAATTLLVRAVPGMPLPRARISALLDGLSPAASGPRETTTITITVRYDGPDLPDVAQHTGLDRDEIIAAHTGQPWLVAFGGFAPGFAYLTHEDNTLTVPRRASPRTRVPAGSVGLAGQFSGIYPRSSPGGWHLIGTTDAVLWDADRDPPALLRPGMRVRFEEAAP
ncbi:allophanate hydrolase subunit 1 [Hoyosella sp. G463]|uniref:Allophanate hydrolase subunit 1 n=2 Tax=Lolliginicoccus lacisalsi TaxID=2742202 RepID=A0A927PKE3_9ACTN|nr:allophanate hydrolase subunit 1 [Lolliginicoccus lacisalsi]